MYVMHLTTDSTSMPLYIYTPNHTETHFTYLQPPFPQTLHPQYSQRVIPPHPPHHPLVPVVDISTPVAHKAPQQTSRDKRAAKMERVAPTMKDN